MTGVIAGNSNDNNHYQEHQECLEKRLTLWRNGEIESLLREGRMIQRRLSKSNKNDPPNKAGIFAKLVMEGQINSALRYLSEDDSGGVLSLTDDVVRQLREKHPDALVPPCSRRKDGLTQVESTRKRRRAGVG